MEPRKGWHPLGVSRDGLNMASQSHASTLGGSPNVGLEEHLWEWLQRWKINYITQGPNQRSIYIKNCESQISYYERRSFRCEKEETRMNPVTTEWERSDISNSRSGKENVQDMTGTYVAPKRKKCSKMDRAMSKEHSNQLKGAFISKIKHNLSIKMIEMD